MGRSRPLVLRARTGVAALREHLRAAGRGHREPLDGHRHPDGRRRLPAAVRLWPGPRLAPRLRRPRALLWAGRAPDRGRRRPGRAGDGERRRLRRGLRVPDGAGAAVVRRRGGPGAARRRGPRRRRPHPGPADVDAGRTELGAVPEPGPVPRQHELRPDLPGAGEVRPAGRAARGDGHGPGRADGPQRRRPRARRRGRSGDRPALPDLRGRRGPRHHGADRRGGGHRGDVRAGRPRRRERPHPAEHRAGDGPPRRPTRRGWWGAT